MVQILREIKIIYLLLHSYGIGIGTEFGIGIGIVPGKQR